MGFIDSKKEGFVNPSIWLLIAFCGVCCPLSATMHIVQQQTLDMDWLGSAEAAVQSKLLFNVKMLCHASIIKNSKTGVHCAMPCVFSLLWFLDKISCEFKKKSHSAIPAAAAAFNFSEKYL